LAKRRYQNHFISKLIDADGEQRETQHWIDTAYDCCYIDNKVADHLNSELEEIGRMLNSMIEKAESFCGSSRVAMPENLMLNTLSMIRRVGSEQSI